MKLVFRMLTLGLLLFLPFHVAKGQNQTDELSPIYPETALPFRLEINTASFSLPVGLQSYSSAIYKGKWIFLAGRTNGLHGFDNIGNSFPPVYQNTTVYVVDPYFGTFKSRSLSESGLTQTQIDELSVTSAQDYQKGGTLYFIGGYGINSSTGQMETKNTLTTIRLKDLLKWVDRKKNHLNDAIRQVSHPLLQVTGGALYKNRNCDPFLLIMGQNFTGLYRDSSNGAYTEQIRSFWLEEQGKKLRIVPKEFSTVLPDYRRRDLNVVPTFYKGSPAYTAFAGVFTLDTGVWTVPVTIFPDGSSIEPNPNFSETFKQSMNHYNCPTFSLYSKHSGDTFVVFPGGISYGYFSGNTFQTDSEIPFINQMTTIQMDKHNNYQQYFLNVEYPYITSTGSNFGNQLLFGAGARFFPVEDVPIYKNGVIQLDKLKKPQVIGYIVGGIMSTLPNTTSSTDTTSSPYIFEVKLVPRRSCE